jgi:hypothetical protein
LHSGVGFRIACIHSIHIGHHGLYAGLLLRTALVSFRLAATEATRHALLYVRAWEYAAIHTQICLCGAVVVGGQSASACGVTPWHTGSIPTHEHYSRMSAATAQLGVCTARSWDPTARAPACHSTPLGGPGAYGQKAAVRLWCVSDGAVVIPPAALVSDP